MGTVSDGLVNRRRSWTGAVVQDLVQPGTPSYGHFYRVSLSSRDAETGRWEIRWSASDYVGDLMPQGMPVYKFDGTTWDLPAYARTVFPTAGLALCVGAGLLFSTFWAALAVPGEREAMIGITWMATAVVFGFMWFAGTEPVRGTKIGAVATAALVAHNVHAKREELRRLEYEETHPSLMSQEIRAQGAGPERDARMALEQQAQILANQRAIATRIGLILPGQHGTGWQR